MMRARLLHFVACALAAASPWLSASPASSGTSRFPGWPAEFEGAPLRPAGMTAGEESLAASFPGRMAKFTDGRRQIVLRFIERDTRLFHPPAECMKGLGYVIDPLPNLLDPDGRQWGSFAATRGTQRLVVRERIYEVSGAKGWTDVSSWYWAAVLGQSEGPWWSAMVAERAASLGH